MLPKGKPKAPATQTSPKPLPNTKHGQNLSTGGNDNRNNITVIEKVGIGWSSTVTTTQAPLSSVSSNPVSTSSPQPTSIDIAEIESKCFYASDDSNKAVRGSGSSASTSDGHSTDIEIPRTGSPFNEALARGIQPSFGQKGHRTTTMKAQTREELASIREGISRGQGEYLKFCKHLGLYRALMREMQIQHGLTTILRSHIHVLPGSGLRVPWSLIVQSTIRDKDSSKMRIFSAPSITESPVRRRNERVPPKYHLLSKPRMMRRSRGEFLQAFHYQHKAKRLSSGCGRGGTYSSL